MGWIPAMLLAGFIFMVLGLPQILFSLWEWRKDEKLLRTGKRTEGIIENSVTYPDDDSLQSGQHRYHAFFLDGDGIRRCAKSRFADSFPSGLMGRHVTVVYDPEDPERSRFVEDISVLREVIEHSAVFTLGLILFVAGGVLL